MPSLSRKTTTNPAQLQEGIRQLMLARRYAECLPLLATLHQSGHGQDFVFYLNYSYALHATGKFREALLLLDEALTAFPRQPELYVLRGGLRQMFGECDAMLDDYRQALSLQPDNGKIRYALGIRELMASNLREGFDNYAFRSHADHAEQFPLTLPRWKGESLHPPPNLPPQAGGGAKGKRLLVVSEQGIGDILMWASLLPALHSSPLGGERQSTSPTCPPKPWRRWKDAGRCVGGDGLSPPTESSCFARATQDSSTPPQGGSCHTSGLILPEKLCALFTRSFPNVTLLPARSGWEQEAERNYDCYTPMGDLMRHLLPSYTPAAHPPYLKADTQHAVALRKRYQNLRTGTKRLVGIAWHTTNPVSSMLRTIPLEQWQPLFALPDIQFVSLQYGDHGQEIGAINRQHPGALHHDPEIDAFEDIDALTAQIMAMDEIITIQNATAHLAGGLGVPTTLLLSSASDWRWGVERTKSLWYNNVDILRQREPLGWAAAMEQVAERLTLLCHPALDAGSIGIPDPASSAG